MQSMLPKMDKLRALVDDLYNCLAGLDPLCFSSFVLIGDFNIDFCNHFHILFSHLCTILHSFSFQQVVEGHTHISPTVALLVLTWL